MLINGDCNLWQSFLEDVHLCWFSASPNIFDSGYPAVSFDFN